jgi:hypothetical protein
MILDSQRYSKWSVEGIQTQLSEMFKVLVLQIARVASINIDVRAVGGFVFNRRLRQQAGTIYSMKASV